MKIRAMRLPVNRGRLCSVKCGRGHYPVVEAPLQAMRGANLRRIPTHFAGYFVCFMRVSLCSPSTSNCQSGAQHSYLVN